MANRKPASNARGRILDAALAVSDRVGAAHLTLDAVAAEAGVSKGGVLYHFASKELLLQGVVEHHMNQQRNHLEIAQAMFPSGPGGYLQAFVQAQCQGMEAKLHGPKATRSLIAAAVNTPELMDSPRQQARGHIERLRALGPDFVDALILTLALDGLFLGDAFEMLDLTATERKALIEALETRAAALAARHP